MFLIPADWYAIKKIQKKGRGTFMLRDIEAGTIIGDYLGTIIPSSGNDERTNGLYDMAGGTRYDILADPKKIGIQLINHSCANNCDIYPYQGHMLYFALRKIFAGEELTVDYALFAPEDDVPCHFHACHCGSKFCKGTMHDNWESFGDWEILLKKNFGPWYRKIPGAYGTELPPLPTYPGSIKKDYPKLYDLFGSEKKSPAVFGDETLPSVAELRKRIRETGRRLHFPKLNITIDGINGDILLVDQNKV